jgi:hypothetical protein
MRKMLIYLSSPLLRYNKTASDMMDGSASRCGWVSHVLDIVMVPENSSLNDQISFIQNLETSVYPWRDHGRKKNGSKVPTSSWIASMNMHISLATP